MSVNTAGIREDMMTFWAIVRKDVIVYLRQVRPFVFLILALAAASFTVYASWPRGEGVSWQLSRTIARATMSFFTFGILFGGALIVPGVAAGAITTERERGAWDMLTVTLIPAWALVAGKLTGVICAFVVLLFGIAPVVATVFFMVGVDPRYFLIAGGIIGATLLNISAMSAALAAWSRKPLSAMRGAYGLAILMMGMYVVPIYIALLALDYFYPTLVDTNHPFFVYYLPATMPPMMLAARGGIVGFPVLPFFIFFAWQGFWTILGALLAYWGVRRGRMTREGESASEFAGRGKGAVTAAGRTPFLDRRNPIGVREWRWGLFQRRLGFWVWLILGAGALFSVSGLFALSIRMDGNRAPDEELLIFPILLHGLILLLAVPASLGNIMTKEKERSTGILLATTPLTAWETLWGKLRASIRLTLIAWFLSVAANLLLAVQLYEKGVELTPFFLAQFTLLAAVMCMAFITVYASTRQKKTASAISIAGALGLLVFIGVTAMLAMFLLRFAPPINDDDVAGMILTASTPIVSIVILFTGRETGDLAIWFANIVYLTGFSGLFLILALARTRRLLRNGFE